MKLILALVLSVTALTSHAQEGGVIKKESKPMRFETCVQSVYGMTKQIPHRVIVSTDIFTVVRFQTAEGSLLASCSKPDQKIALVYTTNPL